MLLGKLKRGAGHGLGLPLPQKTLEPGKKAAVLDGQAGGGRHLGPGLPLPEFPQQPGGFLFRLLPGQTFLQRRLHLVLDLGQRRQVRRLMFHAFKDGEPLGQLHHLADLLGLKAQGGLVEGGLHPQPRDGP